jgi:hypothetical protein
VVTKNIKRLEIQIPEGRREVNQSLSRRWQRRRAAASVVAHCKVWVQRHAARPQVVAVRKDRSALCLFARIFIFDGLK